ncbi:MAG: flagellar export protein FliJ [Gammaproteobacteria bacterium]|nr:MAG: flagellar export protein FliJ [Gammaproteobacteria bacterium]
MTKSSKKLQPVANLARLNERSAARLHGSVLNELKKQEERLDELISYRDQYQTSFNVAGKLGISSIQLQDYRLFLLRLDDAIQQQQQAIINGKKNSEMSRGEWLNKRNKSKMMNKVVEKRQVAEAAQLEKSEQRELEDRPLTN